MVVDARVGRFELRIGDGAQNIEPLLQRRVKRMDIENGLRIEVPEIMVFGLVSSGERFEVGRVGDNVGGARKWPKGEWHDSRMLK